MRVLPHAARRDAYSARFPTYPPLRADDAFLDGVWLLGQNYRGSGYYGSFPPGLLARIWALFPEVPPHRTLHLCSGSLGPETPGVRVDISPALRPTVAADATRLPFLEASFPLAIADPPYSARDATQYGTPMPNRKRMFGEAARVLEPNGHLVWVDTMWPMHRKDVWEAYGFIALVRSTNHRVRLLSIFRRRPCPTAASVPPSPSQALASAR